MTSGILNMGISYQFGGSSRAHFPGFRECDHALLGRCNPAEPLFQYELYAHDGGELFRIRLAIS
jgi:hypothetical protein